MSMDLAPKLSVVIGVLNAAHHIEGCLESIYAQGLEPATFEVLVLDGGSEDATTARVAAFVDRRGIENLRILPNPRRTLAAAFNTAIPQCRGALIGKLDAQGRLGPGYYLALLKELETDSRIGLVGGRFNPVGDTPLAKAWAPVFTDPFLVGPARYRYARARTEIDAAPFGIYRREAIEQVGWFDERILRAEDTDFNLRMRGLGWVIVLQPGVSATYFVRRDLASSFKQFQGYAYWRSFVRRKHGLPLGARQLVPLLWLALMVASVATAAILHNWLLLLPVLLYLAVAAVRARRIMLGSKAAHWLAAFALYPTLHMAYAVGTLRASLQPPGWTKKTPAGAPAPRGDRPDA